MFAVIFDSLGPAELLHLGEVPVPEAPPGTIRIKIKAAGLSPVDVGLRAGRSPMSRTIQFPHIPGFDAAGIVDQVGEGVEGVALGDAVFGAVDIAKLGGAWAEQAVLKYWAAKPASLPWEQAGAAGTSVETATRALDLLGVSDGKTLLIDGASGGVGSIAIQLAIARGARVIGTGRAENQAFIADLGATPLVHGPGLATRLRALGVEKVDLGLDVAGKGSLGELIEIAGSPEAVVTIADFGAAAHGVRLSLGALGGHLWGKVVCQIRQPASCGPAEHKIGTTCPAALSLGRAFVPFCANFVAWSSWHEVGSLAGNPLTTCA